MITLASSNQLTEEEKSSMIPSTIHDRNEQTVRSAIKIIIWDMILSNEKTKEFITLASSNQLTEEEKSTMIPSTIHDRNEQTVRSAIKIIIWDMILSNEKTKEFLTRSIDRKV